MDISKYCYNKSGRGCLEYRDAQLDFLQPYDPKKLEIDTNSGEPGASRCLEALAYVRD